MCKNLLVFAARCYASAAYAVMRCGSVCMCVSVTFVHSVKTNKHIFNFFSPSCSHTILVFPYQTAWQHSNGDPLPNGVSSAGVWKIAIFDQCLALSRKWRKIKPHLLWKTHRKLYPSFQWPWVTSNSDFKVTPFFDAAYLRNGTRYRYSYNKIVIGTYALLKSVISNDLEWLSSIFNDTNHRAVFLRQLSSLYRLSLHRYL